MLDTATPAPFAPDPIGAPAECGVASAMTAPARIATVAPAALGLAACGSGGSTSGATGGGTTSGGTAGGTTGGSTGGGSTGGGSSGGGSTGGGSAGGGSAGGSTDGGAASGGGAVGGAVAGGGIIGGGIIGGGGGTDGGGGTGGTPAPTPDEPVPVVPATITTVQASRFLAQATMGTTRTQIDAVVARRYEGWIDDQFAMPRAISHFDWLVANGYNVVANISNETGFDATVWRQLIVEPDQLRQRVGMALLDFLVVGMPSLYFKQFAVAAYIDVLLDNAFGNYRDILGAITTNSAMGSYLTFMNNRKANPRTGAQPDENYARELMQLFALGPYQLNMDGSPKLAGGQPIETYSQLDVTQLARVFTGLVPGLSDLKNPEYHRLPMTMNSAYHETGSSTVLGVTIAGSDGMAAIKQAIDTIFAHPNVPPFIGRQLIQRLVTSNPGPGYIGRVASVFADNGSGVRGDMKAVIKAILLDSEARSDAALSSSTAGKLREPVMRLTAWARACNASSPSNAWAIGDTSNPATRLGQAMGRSPTVFNFFRPGYTPAGTPIAAAGLVAPEFQITNEQSVVGYVNYMYGLVSNGAGDVRADYTALRSIASDSATLVAEINLVLAAGQLTEATQTAIRNAVNSIPATATNAETNRVGIAIMLTLASPEFMVLK